MTAFSLAAIMMGWLGTVPLAAHQIAINLSAMTYMAALGIAAAATIRVGNELGRHDLTTLRHAASTSFIMVGLFMACTGLTFVIGRFFLPTLYIESAEVRQLAARLLIMAALFQLSDGVQVVALGVLRGLADVRIPTIITLFAYWGVALPTGYFLGFYLSWESRGIWSGLLVGLTLAAGLLFWRYQHKISHLEKQAQSQT
jgi:MATE family multidrug resistance protein